MGIGGMSMSSISWKYSQRKIDLSCTMSGKVLLKRVALHITIDAWR